MKKYFILIIMLLFSFSLNVNAEECTKEKLDSYSSALNKVVVTHKQLGESTAYEIWAIVVPSGIALDKGRTATENNDFLGYAKSGENVSIKVYVADGGVCAGQTLKYINMLIPKGDNQTQQTTTKPVTYTTKPVTNTTKATSQKTTDKKDTKDPSREKTTENNAPPKINQEQTQTSVNKSNSMIDNDNVKVKETKIKNNSLIYLTIPIVILLLFIVLLVIKQIKKKKLKSI